MKQGLTWYKREPHAFLDAVQGFGPELIGAYAVLLDLLYARAGDTPRDDRHLAGILGCSNRKAKALTDRLIDLGKIEVTDDGFMTNSRAKREAFSSRNLSETRAKQGRKGGEKSGEVRKIKALAEASALSKTQAEKRREEKRKKERVITLSEEKPPDRFEEFWNLYPHRGGAKKGKPPARAKYGAAVKRGVSEQDMIDGAVRYHDDRQVIDGYAKDPATWLNQERWSDEIEVTTQTDGGRHGQRNSKGTAKLEAGFAAARAFASR